MPGREAPSEAGGRDTSRNQPRGQAAEEGSYSAPCEPETKLLLLFPTPSLETALFLLQGKVLIISARPSPSIAARSTPLSPPMLRPRKNHHFPILPLSQVLSLLSGLETPDRKECPLSPFSPGVPALLGRGGGGVGGGLALLLQKPASFFCRASILDGMAILGFQVSRNPRCMWLLKTVPKLQHREINCPLSF